ncbi:DNA sulfur modification protein DndE [Alkalihalophilus pseudofirmus]|uniref:DNA sulfur modification protein DndE n=1 Tax=Alkalihalophilus pseudofirmus TaxID=79885 RepID=A0AAJ2KWX4_ALKPS|nr:DNA sulfur modification protein DndE [Alkalihalophilus pseudofirmus]MDV2884686.1 DNA sulfur modification protein DndE [Alkalihalophilus pseudofirmus]
MNFRLKTSSYVADKLKQLHSSTNLTPNILARIAVSLSLKQKSIPPVPPSESSGLEFNRNTLTGDQDYLYHVLVAQHAKKEITDSEFFPDLFNAHLERGTRILTGEYQHAGNYDKFILNLLRQR